MGSHNGGVWAPFSIAMATTWEQSEEEEEGELDPSGFSLPPFPNIQLPLCLKHKWKMRICCFVFLRLGSSSHFHGHGSVFLVFFFFFLNFEFLSLRLIQFLRKFSLFM